MGALAIFIVEDDRELVDKILDLVNDKRCDYEKFSSASILAFSNLKIDNIQHQVTFF